MSCAWPNKGHLLVMSTYDQSALPDPATAPELFEGLLTRRVVAYLIDVVIIGALTALLIAVGLVVGFLTLGLGWLLLPLALPLAIVVYYSATLGSPRRSTIGMGLMDIVLVPVNGRLDGLAILIHPIVFWITVWVAWPFSLAFALFTPRRQMLHDLVTGTQMLRRSPMTRHWAAMAA